MVAGKEDEMAEYSRDAYNTRFPSQDEASWETVERGCSAEGEIPLRWATASSAACPRSASTLDWH